MTLPPLDRHAPAFALEKEIIDLQHMLFEVRKKFADEAFAKGYTFRAIGKALDLSDTVAGDLVKNQTKATRVKRSTLMMPQQRKPLPDRRYKPDWGPDA